MISFDLDSYRNNLSFECVDEQGHQDVDKQEQIINNTYLDEKIIKNRISDYSELYFEDDNISLTLIISYNEEDIVSFISNNYLPITKLKFKTCFIDYNKCNCNNSYRNHTKDIMCSGYIDTNESIEMMKTCEGYSSEYDNTLIKLLNLLPYQEFNLETKDDGVKEYETDVLISYLKTDNLFIKV